MVERQPSKLMTRVRFPSPAPPRPIDKPIAPSPEINQLQIRLTYFSHQVSHALPINSARRATGRDNMASVPKYEERSIFSEETLRDTGFENVIPKVAIEELRKSRRKNREEFLLRLTNTIMSYFNTKEMSESDRHKFIFELQVSLSGVLTGLPRRPSVPPRKWEDAKARREDVIDFALKTYEMYRAKGMTFRDLRTLDKPLYSAFASRCYYLKRLPAEVFEQKFVEMTQPDDGLPVITKPLIQKPRKSEIGKTLSQDEYTIALRKYNAHRQKTHRQRKRLEKSLVNQLHNNEL
jgi:hypothetical protein